MVTEHHHAAFLSTPSARRATKSRWQRQHCRCISIHALREEGDAMPPAAQRPFTYFYPRPPRGGRQLQAAVNEKAEKFLSTPSARRATLKSQTQYSLLNISIHALREEGDHLSLSRPRLSLKQFLSTPSARRATEYTYSQVGDTRFLSTPSARRATAKTEKNSPLLFHYKPICTK